jgi:ribosome-binding factor A
MATDRRVARVAELVKREVSMMLQRDIKDDRVGVGMASITEVVVSGDLQHARIFVSIYGSEEARQETMVGLAAATSFIRREIGQRVGLRRTPEIIFEEDRSYERGVKVLSLINQLSEERLAKEGNEVEKEEPTSESLKPEIKEIESNANESI